MVTERPPWLAHPMVLAMPVPPPKLACLSLQRSIPSRLDRMSPPHPPASRKSPSLRPLLMHRHPTTSRMPGKNQRSHQRDLELATPRKLHRPGPPLPAARSRPSLLLPSPLDSPRVPRLLRPRRAERTASSQMPNLPRRLQGTLPRQRLQLLHQRLLLQLLEAETRPLPATRRTSQTPRPTRRATLLLLPLLPTPNPTTRPIPPPKSMAMPKSARPVPTKPDPKRSDLCTSRSCRSPLLKTRSSRSSLARKTR